MQMKDLTIDALLRHAIKAEIESRKVYEFLTKVAKNEAMKERFTSSYSPRKGVPSS